MPSQGQGHGTQVQWCSLNASKGMVYGLNNTFKYVTKQSDLQFDCKWLNWSFLMKFPENRWVWNRWLASE